MTETRKTTNRIENQHDYNQVHQHHDNNNYNNIHTDPGVFSENALPPDEAMARIAEAYRENISPTITRVAAQLIEDALTHGMEPATVILAIEETGMAARPSPYYLRAILRHWAEFGVVFSKREGHMMGTTKAWPWWK